MTITSQFCDMTPSSNFFDVALFLLSSLVTGKLGMQIWHGCLKWNVPKCCKMQGLHLFTVFELLRKSQQEVKLPPHFTNFLLNFHYKGILQGEMWNWIVKQFFSGYSIIYTTFSSHQRSLEAGSGTWILHKLKQRCQYFNWKSYQQWSNTPYKK